MKEEIKGEMAYSNRAYGVEFSLDQQKQIIAAYKEQIRKRSLTDAQRRILEALVACHDGMGADCPDHYDPCGCGPHAHPASQTPPQQAVTKEVSSCCKADCFRDGDRVICNACRLGTKLIQVSA